MILFTVRDGPFPENILLHMTYDSFYDKGHGNEGVVKSLHEQECACVHVCSHYMKKLSR